MFTIIYRLKGKYQDESYGMGEFSDRKTAELALADLAKNPDFRGGFIKEDTDAD